MLATLLLFTGGVSAQADEIFTVRIENVSAKDALKLSNGKTEPVGVAPVLYVVHTNRAPLFTSGEPDLSILSVRSSFRPHTPNNHVHLEGLPPRTSRAQNGIAASEQTGVVESGNADVDR